MDNNEDTPRPKSVEKCDLSDSNDLLLPSSELISRRQFLTRTAAMTMALALSGRQTNAQMNADMLPDPDKSGIEHVILVMMENRSFDHFLGWLPGADGKQAGLTYMDRNGAARQTSPLAPEFQGCSHPDPDHSYEGGRVQYNNGACDGWLRSGDNDTFAIGYYTQRDLAFLGKAAPSWTVLDRYFAAIMAETYPNRFYQHSAQTDRLHNQKNGQNNTATLPAIWDKLAEKGLTGRYYYNDVPFLGVYGDKYIPISSQIKQFYADCASGKLPQVSYVDPSFLGEDEGLSNDDHPHGDIRNGEVFLSRVYKAVTTSPAWPKTVFIINFDEWGGFFDHVPPPTAPIPSADQEAGNADGRLGFRVPCLIISPFARRGFVSSTVYDHTSILKLIEWRWGLSPLTVRDQTANNIAEALDFTAPKMKVPKIHVPKGPFGAKCPGTITQSRADWVALKNLARSYGWPE